MADDDPNDRLEREMDDIFSHPNPQARIEELLRESRARREREQDELAERLRVQRENDPRHWKGLYEGLLAEVEREKAEKNRQRDVYFGMAIACGTFLAIWFAITHLL